MTEENKGDKDTRELGVIMGLRALLGDPRAQKQMVNLQKNHPEGAKEIMAEAQVRHDALSPEEKENSEKILAKLTATTVKIRLIIILKLFPRAIWGLLKRLNPFGPRD